MNDTHFRYADVSISTVAQDTLPQKVQSLQGMILAVTLGRNAVLMDLPLIPPDASRALRQVLDTEDSKGLLHAMQVGASLVKDVVEVSALEPHAPLAPPPPRLAVEQGLENCEAAAEAESRQLLQDEVEILNGATAVWHPKPVTGFMPQFALCFQDIAAALEHSTNAFSMYNDDRLGLLTSKADELQVSQSWQLPPVHC